MVDRTSNNQNHDGYTQNDPTQQPANYEPESTAHDNDANSRPRISGYLACETAQVEVVVEGAEGESVEDIEAAFDDKLDRLVEAQRDLIEADDDDGRGFN